MCLFIYTRTEACGHTLFQNVAECPVARGIAMPHTPDDRRAATLTTPKFLFDTARSKTHTPESYTRAFTCPKRKAVRPVPDGVCEKCEESVRVRRSLLHTVKEEERGLVVPKKRWGRGRSASSGSSIALVGGEVGPSASSTTSSLGTTSDASTPRSFWKMARPSEVV